MPVVGITNLQTTLGSMPPYWAGFAEFMYRSYGDPRTLEGRALPAKRSPIHKVDRIKKPKLIFHATSSIPTKATASKSRRIGCRTSPSPRRSSRVILTTHASRLAAISTAPATRSVPVRRYFWVGIGAR